LSSRSRHSISAGDRLKYFASGDGSRSRYRTLPDPLCSPRSTSARTAAASSTSRRPLPRARNSSRSRTASANGSRRIRNAACASRANTTTASTICACAQIAFDVSRHGARAPARPRLCLAPEGCGLARPAKRQHAARPRCRGLVRGRFVPPLVRRPTSAARLQFARLYAPPRSSAFL